jgi:outer membrane protein assembly factor BamE (lipoprotein component of BamABCDE complex)
MEEEDMGWRMRLCGGLVALASLGACDYFAQKELKPGVSTVDDVRRMMGKPEMIWEEEDGSQVLEFVRGPEGTETYMVEIDAEGRYLGMKNVLVQENFDRVRPGMIRDDVRRLLGKPTEKESFPLKREDVWSWRFSSEYNRPDMFNVHFDPDGRVVSTSVTAARDGPEPGR